MRGRKRDIRLNSGLLSPYRKREIPVRGRKRVRKYDAFMHGTDRKREIPVRGRKPGINVLTNTKRMIEKEKSP